MKKKAIERQKYVVNQDIMYLSDEMDEEEIQNLPCLNKKQ